MPSVIYGPVIFNSNEGQIITGDTLNVSPNSTSKVVAGSGGFNTGYWIITNNGVSTSSAVDPDVADQNLNDVGT